MIDVKIYFTKTFDKIHYAVFIAGCSGIAIPAAKARELISAGVPVIPLEESK